MYLPRRETHNNATLEVSVPSDNTPIRVESRRYLNIPVCEIILRAETVINITLFCFNLKKTSDEWILITHKIHQDVGLYVYVSLYMSLLYECVYDIITEMDIKKEWISNIKRRLEFQVKSHKGNIRRSQASIKEYSGCNPFGSDVITATVNL